MSVKRLAQAIPPPNRESEVRDWRGVESELGRRLPDDYKEITERYGPGVFGDFLHIYQPDSPWPQLDLAQQVEDELTALKELAAAGEEIPYKLDRPAEIVTFGRDENGDSLFWHCRDMESPNNWTVLVKDARAPDWFPFGGGLSDFLTAVLAGRTRFPVFPADFPPIRPGFATYVI
ncbi:hypothetical protein DY218_04235 [Streptomyces triticagri]|uniref:Knr4/Smi1-like domain-containing protein n=1 Tax=Streptomyces triticagri TaxID=2293568 RepID=A0A372MBI4_9ACTN|nr:SMI1/KNR4 family protein [Streptomyces triticagri]RFU87970.1 hypothetical protein DY218_04235 [Streptomyces triticagri]